MTFEKIHSFGNSENLFLGARLLLVTVKSLWLIKQKRNCNKQNGTLQEKK